MLMPGIPGGFVTRNHRLIRIKGEKFWGIRTSDGIEVILTPEARVRLKRIISEDEMRPEMDGEPMPERKEKRGLRQEQMPRQMPGGLEEYVTGEFRKYGRLFSKMSDR